jgi:hypothetical protein
MTSYHGGFVNLGTGVCTPLRVDSLLWRRATARRRRETKTRNAIAGRAAQDLRRRVHRSG